MSSWRAAVHTYYHLVSPLTTDRLEGSHRGTSGAYFKKDYFTFYESQNKTVMRVGSGPRLPGLRTTQTQTFNSCVTSFKLPNFILLQGFYL